MRDVSIWDARTLIEDIEEYWDRCIYGVFRKKSDPTETQQNGASRSCEPSVSSQVIRVVTHTCGDKDDDIRSFQFVMNAWSELYRNHHSNNKLADEEDLVTAEVVSKL